MDNNFKNNKNEDPEEEISEDQNENAALLNKQKS